MLRIVIGFLLLAFALQPAKPPKPGVKMPGVKIAIERLKPEAVFPYPGSPDWIAVDESVWVSNRPKDSVARLDPKTNTVAATIRQTGPTQRGFIDACAITVMDIQQVSLRQGVTPSHLQGRMNATFRTLFWGVWPLANFLGGLIADWTGPVSVFLIAAGLRIIPITIVVVSPIGRLRSYPAAAAQAGGISSNW